MYPATKITKQSVCNKCRLPIGWRILPSGKRCPSNPDGSDHWDDCKAEINKSHSGIRVMMTSSGWITGRDYVTTKSDKLAWEA